MHIISSEPKVGFDQQN